MKIKTKDLVGIQLDYAAALATGQKVDFEADTGCLWFEEHDVWFTWSPSTEWAQSGPMMESFSISCYQSAYPATGKVYHWVGVNELVAPGHRRGLIADNPRVAVCRAVVFAKFGDEIEIPDELEGAA
ncbi:TPA: phage protein NinX family protein [Klebsiella pneumoniae]